MVSVVIDVLDYFEDIDYDKMLSLGEKRAFCIDLELH